MKNKIRNSTLSFLLALALLVVPMSNAAAAPPLGVHIEVDEIIGGSGELFLASGSAVDAGVLCPFGKVNELSTEVSSPGGGFTNLRVLKEFICGDDNSNTFFVRMNVRLNNTTGETTARWRFAGGTGAYTSLHGNGSLVGTPIVPGVSIHDVYDGVVH
jgi:hypothetical protein